VTLDYDSSNRIIRAVDPIGRTWSYTYEGTPGVAGPNGLTTVTDPLTHVMRYDYVNGGRLSKVTDKRGIVAKQITYDGNGRVVQQRYADGGIEEYSYVLSGRVVTLATMIDALSRTTSMRLNASGYVIGTTDALGQSSQTERDLATSLPTSVKGPCGCVEASRQFDDRGNITIQTDRIGQASRIEYEPVFNRVTRATDKLGRVTILHYDSRGNLTSMTDALNETTAFTYNANGQLTSTTSALGHINRFEYDANGDLTALIDPLVNRTSYEYDGIGRLTAMVDPLGRRTQLEYDFLGRIIALTDQSGAMTRFNYDQNGNETSFVDALSGRSANTYDAKDRLVSAIDTVGRVTRLEYNADDELTAEISPSGRTVRYNYDQRGQPITVTNPLGDSIRLAYDNRGNVTALSDQRGSTMTFTYDELFRPVSRRDALGQVSTVEYDALSNVAAVVDRLGRRTNITYDVLDRPSRVAYADAAISYNYDAASRLIRVDDTQSESIQFGYDDAGRLLTEVTSLGVVRYTYNSVGQPLSMTAADRPPVTYGYDSAGRLQTITQGAEVFTNAYDALSRRTSLQRPNGVRTDYSYDKLNRVKRLTHTKAGSPPIEDLQYTYNLDDHIESITSLASAPLLMPAKNAGPANAANRITQFGGASFSFDAKGQTVAKTDVQGTRGYEWDARGRMIRATLPSGQSVSYGYDTLGRMTSRASGDAITNFLYDGTDIVVDRRSDGTALDYLNGGGVDDKLRQTSGATGPLYFIPDHLGSTAAVTDASGNLSERIQYDPFGESAGSSLTRYGYTGRERDDTTGLIYYRARWYDPQQGRFISEDPIGLAGNDPNLYRYVGNDPINLTDPLGLATLVVFVGPRQSRRDRGTAYVVLQDKCGSRVPICRDPSTLPFGDSEALFEGRAAGTAGPGRMVKNGDTPFGIYSYDQSEGGRKSYRAPRDPDSYGTGKIFITPLYGEALDTTPKARGDLRVHGGGSGLPDSYAPTQDLIETHGCVRLQNRDVDSLIGALKGLKDKKDPVEYVFIGDNAYLNNLATRNDLPPHLRNAQRQLRIALGSARPDDWR